MKFAEIKWTSFLKYFLIAVALILIGGIVGIALLGINQSVDFVGGTSFEVSVEKDEDVESVKKAMLDYINEKNYDLQKCYTKYIGTKNVVVAVVRDAGINSEVTESELIEKTEQSEAEVARVGSIVRGDFLWKTILAGVILAVVALLYFGFRKSWVIGSVSCFSGVLTALLTVCVLILTRVKITLAGVAIILLFELISATISGILAIKAKGLHDEKENKEQTIADSMNKVISKNLLTIGCFALGVIVATLVVLIFVCSAPLAVEFVLQTIVAVVVFVFVSMFVMTGVYTELEQLCITKTKQKLSKNVVSKPQSTKRKETVAKEKKNKK